MPYRVVKDARSCGKEKPWMVVVAKTGKKVGGCHASPGEAHAQRVAIEKAEKKRGK